VKVVMGDTPLASTEPGTAGRVGSGMVAFVSELLAIFRRFYRWWLGELAGLVPRWLRRRFTAPKDRLVLLPGEGDVVPS